jgi:hypothetical protein
VSPRDQIARLQGLLERVRANAAKPRPVADRRASGPEVPTPVPPKVEVAPPVAVSPFPLAPVTPEPPPVSAAPPPVPSVSVPAWQPEPGSSVQPRPPSAPPEELSDDDLLEVTTIPPAAISGMDEPAADLSVDVDVSMDEEAPVSSSRSKLAASMDEALESAPESEDEHDVPVKTPPPESGPQAAGPPSVELDEPGMSDVDTLEAGMLGSMGPTAEQLGETIELEAPRGPMLEIDVGMSDAPEPEPERPLEELEVTLPRGQMPSGLYDVDPVPMPPATATPAPPAAEDRTSSIPPEPRPTARPELGAAEIARVVLGNRPTISHTFVDVLDRSLAL